ncbi:MAG: carboxypeptidase regulatory-like domain-containing protein [Acidobacteriota bacterium]|nr:carboxypeptidase regulatory-like domain-containing protein [Acidobacteriota bacterium]
MNIRKADRRKPLTLAGLILALAACGLPAGLCAQQTSGPAASNQGLPDAPGIETSFAAAGSASTSQNASALVSGTVVDTNGEELAGARVTLAGPVERSAVSGGNGEFTFAGLPAGDFTLKVTGKGMGSFLMQDIVLRRGDVRFFPKIVLSVAAAETSVEVVANPEQLAEQQIHLEMQQRVFGIVPNFYTSYDWNAQHLWAKQKFQLAFRAETDPVAFVEAGVVAGAEQIVNRFPAYGSGAQGFAKRYGAAYANHVVGDMVGSALLPSLFHQDPRYFYKGTGSFRSRALYAISAAVMCRGDNGRWEPNYSHVLGNFAAGGISNLYVPSANRGASLVLTQGLIDIGADAGGNLLREFVLRGFTSHIAGSKGSTP